MTIRSLFPPKLTALLLAGLALLPATSCGNNPFQKQITIHIINDTEFDVDPNIVFDDDTSLLAGWFPSETLETGLIEPGGLATFYLPCSDVGVLLSDNAKLIDGGLVIATAGDSVTLTDGDNFECQDVIELQFIGTPNNFAVVTYVNDVEID